MLIWLERREHQRLKRNQGLVNLADWEQRHAQPWSRLLPATCLTTQLEQTQRVTRRLKGLQAEPSFRLGFTNELRICADLLDKGFEVFRNVAATGVDLIAYKDGRATRIEVKTTTVRTNGDLHVPNLRPEQPCEVLAIVYNGQVRYHDPLTKLPVCL
jgi:hypothetical protein